MIIEQKLDLRNTGLKLVIDQSIGGALNTIAFLFLMAAVRGGSFSDCTEAVRLVSSCSRVGAMALYDLLQML